MGFLNNIFHHNKSPSQEIIISESNPRHDVAPKNTSAIKSLFVKFANTVRLISDNRERIVAPEFNFDDIYNASVTDSYVKMALSKYKSLLFKAGYQLKGENDDAIDYLKKRFRIFGITCTKPMDILFQEIGDDLVTYSNAFIVKSRSDKLQMPGVKASGIFDERFVTGYFRIDPCCVYIKKNKHGSIDKYIYRINGEEQFFSPKDVIHFYIDKDPNNNYGTPMIIAALEDVKLLRRIEGNVVALIYRFVMPIYHWMCGLPQDGKGATDAEIETLRDAIAGMDIDGCIVTNERTNVKAIGAEGTALDANGYLGYFEKRVFSALGVSESQMGRGGSKQDADSMESQMHDAIKHFQRHISVFIENYMLMELLLEGGFDPITNEHDYVSFTFNEISLETKIKVENHELAKFQANMTTFSEARHEIGLRSDSVDFDELYNNMITNESAIEQIDAKAESEIKVAKATSKLTPVASSSSGQTSKSIKGNGKQKSAKNASNGTIKSINTPSNQHGATSVKIKESIDLCESMNPKRAHIHSKYKNIYELYQNIKEETVINKSDLSFILPVCFNNLGTQICTTSSQDFIDGANKFISECDTDASYIFDDYKRNDIVSKQKDSIMNLMNDIKKSIDPSDSDESIRAVFDKYEYRIDFIISYYSLKSYNLGYISQAKLHGVDKVFINFNSDIDKENHDGDVINTSAYTLDDIPAYHPFCECSLCAKK